MSPQAGMPRPRASGLELALALLLVFQGAAALIGRFDAEPGLDFYHFWGIAAARNLAAETLGDPYAAPERYAELLNASADASRDSHFRRANALRRDAAPGASHFFDPTGTPLAYLAFAFLPAGYSRAHAVFRALQLAAGLAGIALLLRQLRFTAGRCLVAAGALALCYRPLAIDWNVGNLNAFQLLFAALLLRLTAGAPLGPAPARLTSAERTLWAGLAAFVLFKPNFAFLALGMAAGQVLRRGPAVAARGAGVAALAAVALLALSSAFLGSASAWLDWWRSLAGPAGDKLAAYPIGSGNQSPAVLLAAQTGIAPGMLSGLLALALAASAWLAPGLRPGGSRPGPHALADPFAAASLGTLFAFATSPLVWNHYAVLLLLPASWLAARSQAVPRGFQLASLLAVALVAGGLDGLLQAVAPGFASLRPLLLAFAWLPLWIHALAALRPGTW